MKRYYVIYLPTGRRVNNRNGSPLILRGNTERGAKMNHSRAGHYLEWNLHVLMEVAS